MRASVHVCAPVLPVVAAKKAVDKIAAQEIESLDTWQRLLGAPQLHVVEGVEFVERQHDDSLPGSEDKSAQASTFMHGLICILPIGVSSGCPACTLRHAGVQQDDTLLLSVFAALRASQSSKAHVAVRDASCSVAVSRAG